MAQNSPPPNRTDWVEGSGLPHLFRILGLAVHPPKLGLALAAIIVTLVLGGILNWLSTLGGGVDATAVSRFIEARALDQVYEEPEGDRGVLSVWWEHQEQSILGMLGSSGMAGAPTELYGTVVSSGGRWSSFVSAGYGTWWLLRCHPLWFILFGIGALIIWSWGGGAICRIAALQFARDEKLTMKEAVHYAREHLFGGYVLAPVIPLAFIIIVMLLMVVAGVVLWIPVFGDLLGGLTFIFSILGGFVIAVLLLGLLVGGHFFWPAVAAEGQDAYDAFSRALSYAFSKPWKTVLYGVIALIYANICWILLNLFTLFSLRVTHAIVGFGTSPFGWWGRRGTVEAPLTKLDSLWPLANPGAIHVWPDWSNLTWYEYISAFLITIWLLLVLGLVWSFLCSFYYSGSTVMYFLLRRDVDKTDLDDVYKEEQISSGTELPGASASISESPAENSSTVAETGPSAPEPTAAPESDSSADEDTPDRDS